MLSPFNDIKIKKFIKTRVKNIVMTSRCCFGMEKKRSQQFHLEMDPTIL